MNDNEPLRVSSYLAQSPRELAEVRARQHTKAIIGWLEDLRRLMETEEDSK